MIESPLLDKILAIKERQTSHDYILHALTVRFKDVPADLADKLRAIEDESHLKYLHQLAIVCADLEAFRIGMAHR